ncbi:sensor histidine kinase [Thalassospira lucentensis]|uniref:sensor histidine kinase n=1 Tax=Thalassospira lucentensis TaxID=168935 RepID=UPI003D2EAEEE
MSAFFSNSLTGRIVRRVTLCVFTLWLVGSVLAAFVIHDELGEAFDSGLQETARRTLPLAVQFHMNRSGQDRPARMPAFTSSEGGKTSNKLDESRISGEYLIYQLRDGTGNVLLRSHDTTDTPFDAPLQAGFWEDSNYRYYTESSVSSSLFLQVAEPMAHRHEAALESSLAVLLPLIVLVPAIVVAIWLSVRSGLVPVRHLRDEIGLRGGGNLDPVELDETPRELSGMVNAINMLLVRLRAALNAERSFAANSAHELRTPIASALAQLQQLQLEVGDNSPVRERTQKVEMSLDRLRRLSEKLLQWSRAEAGIGRSPHPHQLSPIVEMMIEDIERSNRFTNKLVATYDDVPLIAAVDPDAFGICLRNLLENALLHGTNAEPVQVHATGPATISVENACPVIPPELLGRLANRFERHGSHPESTGLGLSIATTIISQAGGTLELMSPRPGKPDGFVAILNLG